MSKYYNIGVYILDNNKISLVFFVHKTPVEITFSLQRCVSSADITANNGWQKLFWCTIDGASHYQRCKPEYGRDTRTSNVALCRKYARRWGFLTLSCLHLKKWISLCFKILNVKSTLLANMSYRLLAEQSWLI